MPSETDELTGALAGEWCADHHEAHGGMAVTCHAATSPLGTVRRAGTPFATTPGHGFTTAPPPIDVTIAHHLVGMSYEPHVVAEWEKLPVARIQPDRELHSPQTGLDPDVVTRYERDPGPPVRLYNAEDGSCWVLDGHHRVTAARNTGRPFDARTMTQAHIDELRARRDQGHW